MRIKMLSLMILLGGALVVHGLAWGAPINCNAALTVGDWRSATDGCRVFNGTAPTDKVFTLESGETTVPDAVGVSISFTALGTGDLYKVNLTFDTTTGGNGVGPQSYVLDYDVVIDSGPLRFKSVSLDSDDAGTGGQGGAGDVSVVKVEENGKFSDMTSKNGASAGTQAIPGGQTTLDIQDTITIGNNAILSSMTETFKQTSPSEVPEPSTFFLVGLGLTTFGLLRRRHLC